MTFKSYREESKKNWGTNQENFELEQIKCGALLRIADAVEKITSNYNQLLSDVRLYKNAHAEAIKREQKLIKQVAGFKGYLKKLKSK